MRWKAGFAVALWLVLVGCNLVYARAQGCAPVDLFIHGLMWLRTNPWGPAVFVLLYVLRPIALLPASILAMAAGCCFGAGWGLFWAIVGSSVAALAGYVVGSFFGLPDRQPAWMHNAMQVVRRFGTSSIMVLRWCFLPYDPVSYLGGAMRFPLPAFLLASLLGNLPGTTSCVLFGASLELPWVNGIPRPDLRLQLVSGLFFALMLVGASRMRRHFQGAQPCQANNQGGVIGGKTDPP